MRTVRPGSPAAHLLRWVVLLIALLAVAISAMAATPSSGTINTPADDTLGTKQTLTYTGGPLAVSTGFSNLTGEPACDAANAPGACDTFLLTVNLPGNYWSTHAGNLTVKLTWTADLGVDPSVNDLDVYVVDSQGRDVGHGADTNPAALGGTGKAQETAVVPYIPGGQYKIIVIDSASVTVTPSFSVTVTFNLTAPPSPAPATAQIFQNFVSPVPTDGSPRMAAEALEPSIGVNWVTGNAMFQATQNTLRISFDDSVYPAKATWTDVTAPIANAFSEDPILWTDPRTHRTFVANLDLACSLGAYTDDDGANWFQSPLYCAPGAEFDHETLGGGPFSPNGATKPLTSYPDAVYYCAHDDVTAKCGVSVDGGDTFLPGIPAYSTLDCGTISGHIRSAPDGTVYLPNRNCGGQVGVWISKDNATTWTLSKVPGSTGSLSDPWVDFGARGTVYFGWTDLNGHAYVAVSTDGGATWQPSKDVGTAVAVVNSEFPALVAGDDERAAFAFLGTQTAGNDQSDTFPGAWHLYVAFTYDRGSTWTTYDATPNDPVQRGCIWLGGFPGTPCRNLRDFMGIAMDKYGRVLVGYGDGCIDDPLNPANRCVTNPPADVRDTIRGSLGTIARQTGGLGLVSAYDGKIFKTPPGAPSLTGMAGNNVNHLTWSQPSNGGLAITNYKIYRSTASNSEKLLTTVGNVTSYDDTAVTNGTTYYYRVSAVNAAGEGATSNEVALTPAYSAAPSAPRKLKAMGEGDGVMLVWSKPASSGTAPITNYRVYRGTAPGAEVVLTTVGTATKYSDNSAQQGTTYYYVVTAINSVGESPKSNEVQASTNP